MFDQKEMALRGASPETRMDIYRGQTDTCTAFERGGRNWKSFLAAGEWIP
jgi:hypothetical protein